MSPGEQMVDLVYISDVLDAYLISFMRLLENKHVINESYGISSGKMVTIKELVNIIIQLVNTKPKITWGARPYRNREVFKPWRPQKILPNWSPAIGLEEGLMRSINGAISINTNMVS